MIEYQTMNSSTINCSRISYMAHGLDYWTDGEAVEPFDVVSWLDTIRAEVHDQSVRGGVER